MGCQMNRPCAVMHALHVLKRRLRPGSMRYSMCICGSPEQKERCPRLEGIVVFEWVLCC